MPKTEAKGGPDLRTSHPPPMTNACISSESQTECPAAPAEGCASVFAPPPKIRYSNKVTLFFQEE